MHSQAHTNKCHITDLCNAVLHWRRQCAHEWRDQSRTVEELERCRTCSHPSELSVCWQAGAWGGASLEGSCLRGFHDEAPWSRWWSCWWSWPVVPDCGGTVGETVFVNVCKSLSYKVGFSLKRVSTVLHHSGVPMYLLWCGNFNYNFTLMFQPLPRWRERAGENPAWRSKCYQCAEYFHALILYIVHAIWKYFKNLEIYNTCTFTSI